MTQQDKTKKRMKLPVSAWLSYLLLATFLLTGVTFSKFTATTDGIDSARVAKFDVTVSGSGQAVDVGLKAGETATHTFTVTNNSEVAVDYYLELTGMPAGITAAVSDGLALNTKRKLAAKANASLTLTLSAAADAGDISGKSVSLLVHTEQTD